jgi:hypothetical protein
MAVGVRWSGAVKVEARRREATLTAQLLHRHAQVGLLEEPDDLLFAESLLHV